MAYSKGAKRSQDHKLARAKSADTHSGIAASLAGNLPAVATLQAHEPARLDQGQTGSCTAHSLMGAIYTALGSTLGFPFSPDVNYKGSRAIERATAAPPGTDLPGLSDSGAELADAIQAASEGVAPMMGPTPDGRNSDVDPSTVDDEPNLQRLQLAATRVITGEYRITATGKDLSAQAAASINAGFPVYTGFFCDTAFENLSVGQVAKAPDTNDPNGGGHAVFLDAYSTNPDGTRTFRLVNSWGTGWCDAGACLVSEEWLAAAWEAWVIDVTIKQGS